MYRAGSHPASPWSLFGFVPMQRKVLPAFLPPPSLGPGNEWLLVISPSTSQSQEARTRTIQENEPIMDLLGTAFPGGVALFSSLTVSCV